MIITDVDVVIFKRKMKICKKLFYLYIYGNRSKTLNFRLKEEKGRESMRERERELFSLGLNTDYFTCFFIGASIKRSNSGLNF